VPKKTNTACVKIGRAMREHLGGKYGGRTVAPRQLTQTFLRSFCDGGLKAPRNGRWLQILNGTIPVQQCLKFNRIVGQWVQRTSGSDLSQKVVRALKLLVDEFKLPRAADV
jgi:hypothetical protein